ncbi:MAG: hypothetical protein KDD62_05720, partial [Bdellovibrionales bacterium]|nr:hypothetical protein [Bdellovibrionales bacterium]
ELEQIPNDRVAAFVGIGIASMAKKQALPLTAELVKDYSAELRALSNCFQQADDFNTALSGFSVAMNGYFSHAELKLFREQMEKIKVGDIFAQTLANLCSKIDYGSVDRSEQLTEFGPIVQRIFRAPSERDIQVALRERRKSDTPATRFEKDLLPLAPCQTFVREYVNCPSVLSQPYMQCLAKTFYGQESALSSDAIERFASELGRLAAVFPERDAFEKSLKVLESLGLNQTTLETLNNFFRTAPLAQQEFVLDPPDKNHRLLINRIVGVKSPERPGDSFDWNFLPDSLLPTYVTVLQKARGTEAWHGRSLWASTQPGTKLLTTFPSLLREVASELSSDFIEESIETWIERNSPKPELRN